jgi:hypothetical protein
VRGYFTDLIGRVFQSIRSKGILGRRRFTCCHNCGCAAITDLGLKRGYKFYVFYHQQDFNAIEDTESGISDVYLSYGIVTTRTKVTRKMGRDVRGMVKNILIPALQKRGLSVEWNGNIATRLKVSYRSRECRGVYRTPAVAS